MTPSTVLVDPPAFSGIAGSEPLTQNSSTYSSYSLSLSTLMELLMVLVRLPFVSGSQGSTQSPSTTSPPQAPVSFFPARPFPPFRPRSMWPPLPRPSRAPTSTPLFGHLNLPSTLPPLSPPISSHIQPQVPLRSSGAGPRDRPTTAWPVPAPASSPPTIQVSIPTEEEGMHGSPPNHASGRRMQFGSMPDLRRVATAAHALAPASIPNADHQSLRSMPNLRRAESASEASLQLSESSEPSVNLRELRRFPVAHRLTTFAQDLFLDAIYQEERGGWRDFDDNLTVTRLSREMAIEVSDSQLRAQAGRPEGQREVVEAGS